MAPAGGWPAVVLAGRRCQGLLIFVAPALAAWVSLKGNFVLSELDLKFRPVAPQPRGSAGDAGKRCQQAAAAQFVAELAGEALSFLPPQAAQMAKKHQGAQGDRQADEQLQADLEHGGGKDGPTGAENASLGAARRSCSAGHAVFRFLGA